MSRTTSREVRIADLDDTLADTASLRRRGWLVTITLMLFMFVNFADKSVVGIVGVELQHDLGISSAQYGLLQSVFFWPFAVGALVLGALGGRVSARWLLTGLVALWIVSLIPLTGIFTSSFALLVVARMLLGFAEGPAAALAQQITHTWFVPKRRSLPSSVVIMGASLGPLIAAPALTWVMQKWGWQACFQVLIVLGLIWMGLWLVVGREGPAATAQAGAPAADGAASTHLPETAPLRVIWLLPTVFGTAFFSFCSYWATSLKVSWLPVYLRQGLHYTATETGYLVALPFAAAVVFTFLAGMVSGRLLLRGVSSRTARGALAAALLLGGGVSMILFTLLPAGVLQIVFITLAFSLNTAAWGLAFSLLSDVVPAKQRASVMSTIVAIYSLGGAAAPLLIGWLVSGTDSKAEGYGYGFMVVGVIMMAGAAVAYLCAHPQRDARRLIATCEERAA
ncbi:MFS transporter [Tsukamurella sp. 1534]|uniref:MFS transporter n=1 Tax=Tsukamurella sp. 1534 TaxID=1151061 RepID=UPI0002F69539|nr:MFS transporter [Tsukamurella sp. 1534]